MEGKRDPRKGGPSRKHYKDVATQTLCSCKNSSTKCHCLDSIHEICDLCQKRILSVSSPNDIQIGDDLPDTICVCFVYDANAPGAANFENVSDEERLADEENGLANAQVDDPQNLNAVEEESGTVESNSISNNNLLNCEESKLLEYSSGSTGSSPSELSFDLHLPNRKRTLSNSEKNSNSPNTGQNDHASSLQEQSFDQNSTDQRNITSSTSARGFQHCSYTEKDSSSDGYPLSPNEQSPDGNSVDLKKSVFKTQEADDSKNFSKENDASRQSLSENLEQLNISEYKFERFSSGRGEKNEPTERGEKDYQYPFQINTDGSSQFASIPTELTKFRSENVRPALPAPFYSPLQYYQRIPPPYQPQGNPTMNVSRSLPYQSYRHPTHLFGNPTAVNMPRNQMSVPGRFPVVSRPQMTSTPHQRPNNDGSDNFSRRLQLLEAQDSEKMSAKRAGIVEDWLQDLKVQIEASGYEGGWSSAENEENEGRPPCPEDTFFPDELSSTEISEEENRRQRSERRPPRKNKK